MKRILGRNQLIIAALAVMIAVAGYLNYSGRIFGERQGAEETSTDLADQELLDISSEDAYGSEGEIASLDGDLAEGEVEGTPGEAVLTSSQASGVIAEAKVSREQVRARNRETLQAVIDDVNISDQQKTDAIAQIVEMTELAEKEVAIETLLASKGFTEAVVSLSRDEADVVVNSAELSDARLAQIEDIVTRKAGVDASNIVITPIHTGEDQEEQ